MEKESLLAELPIYLENYPGKYYFKYEQEHLNSLLPELHGYFLVHLGMFDNFNLKASSMIPNQIYLGTEPKKLNHATCVVSKLSELPFQNDSVDLFILPHTLEFSARPDKLLSEIFHTLIPGGKVIILGFNPFSMVGLTKLIKSVKNRPWCGRLHSVGHIKFWLRATGFSLESQSVFCYRPPLKNETLLNKLSFLEPFGQFCLPFLGGVYLLIAEKKAMAVTTLRKKVYPKKLRVRTGFPEPSTNKSI